MSVKRAAGLVGGLSLAGLGISAYIAYVHAQIAAQQIPSCDINQTVSCSVVLSSDYAYLFGTIPVAWAALLTYAAFAALAFWLVAGSAKAKDRRRFAGLLFAGAIGGAIYSVFLAAVAVLVLGAVCILCTGLYVVNAGLLVGSVLLLSAVRRETSRGREPASGLVRWVAVGAVAGLSIVLGLIAWEASRGGGGLPPADFVRWYDSLPTVVDPPRQGHAKGPANSPVVIAEFSDFECGHCAQVYRAFKSVLPRYRDDVRIEFFHYPLDTACNPALTRPLHGNACLAAVASECAAAQGKFWPYHDLLFDNQKQLDRANLVRFAARVGLDEAAFTACLDSDEAKQAVANDIARGTSLEVKSTPTLFVNDRVVRGSLAGDKLEHVIRIERERSQRSN